MRLPGMTQRKSICIADKIHYRQNCRAIPPDSGRNRTKTFVSLSFLQGFVCGKHFQTKKNGQPF
jgi:hypothetical protein